MTLEQRVQHLELELRKARPSASSDAPALLKRISALESEIARLKSRTPTKPAVYTPAPAPVVAKPADMGLSIRLTNAEREIERLKVKESSIISNYLLTTGKAADSDKLDGLDSTAYLLTTGKAADSDKLDGIDSTGFATAGHDHNAAYLGITAKAADADKLDGVDSSLYVRQNAAQSWTPSPTAGWSSYTQRHGMYVIVGNMCYFSLYVQGTSNSTAVTITLPASKTSVNVFTYFVWTSSGAGKDNGTSLTAPVRCDVQNNSTVMKIYKNYSGAAWTASNEKIVIASGFFAFQ